MIMNENIGEEFGKFQSENKEFKKLVVWNGNEIIFQSGEADIDAAVCATIVDAWDNHEGSVSVNDMRYIILKSDPLQLAATKPGPGGRQIVGSQIKGNYGISFIENGPNMNASSVYFQKWLYDKI